MTTAILAPVGYKQPAVPWNGLTVTDLFCGAGGSSSGLVAAGFKVVTAANHWQQAIDSHQINHPETDHSSADISQVNPGYFQRTDILWASPECTNHSVAKGVKRQRAVNEALFDLDGTAPLPDEAANRSRATMYDVPRFAEHHQYRAIIIENVVDAYRWVPFPAWLMTMELLGYEHELVWLNSMHAQGAGLPAPQSRDRMYIVFWRKGERKPNIGKWTRPQAFCENHGMVSAVQAFKKEERWGRYRAQYVYRCPSCATIIEPAWLPAASAIDWSIAGERIGDKKKPLADKTRARIEKGIERYWKPLLVTAAGNTYDGITTGSQYLRAYPTDMQMPTQTTTVQHGLAVHPLITDGIRGEGTVQHSSDPMHTQTTAQTKGIAYSPLMVPVEGREGKSASLASDPARTQSTRNETAIAFPPFLAQFRQRERTLDPAREPLTTVVADGAGQALIVPLRNNGVTKPATHPIDTVSAGGNHHALITNHVSGADESRSKPVSGPLPTFVGGGTHASLLVPYYGASEAGKPTSDPHGTLTTTDRYGLVESEISLDVDDVLFRMLTPNEIKVGMAFAHDYYLGGTKREQVKQAGNAVTPPAARDLGMAVAEALNGVDVERAA